MATTPNDGQRPGIISSAATNSLAEVARDPLRLMIEIIKDSKISDVDKNILISLSRERFTNRHCMAYISLEPIIGSFYRL